MTQTSKRAEACCQRLAGLLSPRLFKAFADPTRLALLVRLAGRGPTTVSGAAEGSGIDVSVVSRHLAVLREAGVIECVRRGKEVVCAARTAPVAEMLRELADALEACCPEGVCACPATPRPARAGRTRRDR